MKLALVLFVAVSALVQSERLCRSNCDSDENFNDGTSSGCYCDPSCENANDCCDSYIEFCTDGDSTDDSTCQGCPDGPQTSTARGSRGSCYCDAACVESGDCCPSYEKYCANDEVNGFCDTLASAERSFCSGGALYKAFYYDLETSENSDGVEATYADTCGSQVEIDESEDVHVCEDRGLKTYRYACYGGGRIFAQECTYGSTCRDRDCEGEWTPMVTGQMEAVDECLSSPIAVSENKDVSHCSKFLRLASTNNVQAQAGTCSFYYNPSTSDYSARTFGCTAIPYDDASDAEWWFEDTISVADFQRLLLPEVPAPVFYEKVGAGYCFDYIYLPGFEGEAAGILTRGDPLFNEDKNQECLNRCQAAAGINANISTRGFYIEDYTQGCGCSAFGCPVATIDAYTYFSDNNNYTTTYTSYRVPPIGPSFVGTLGYCVAEKPPIGPNLSPGDDLYNADLTLECSARCKFEATTDPDVSSTSFYLYTVEGGADRSLISCYCAKSSTSGVYSDGNDCDEVYSEAGYVSFIEA